MKPNTKDLMAAAEAHYQARTLFLTELDRLMPALYDRLGLAKPEPLELPRDYCLRLWPNGEWQLGKVRRMNITHNAKPAEAVDELIRDVNDGWIDEVRQMVELKTVTVKKATAAIGSSGLTA